MDIDMKNHDEKNEKRKGNMDMEKQKKKQQESGHWKHAARPYS